MCLCKILLENIASKITVSFSYGFTGFSLMNVIFCVSFSEYFSTSVPQISIYTRRRSEHNWSS